MPLGLTMQYSGLRTGSAPCPFWKGFMGSRRYFRQQATSYLAAWINVNEMRTDGGDLLPKHVNVKGGATFIL